MRKMGNSNCSLQTRVPFEIPEITSSLLNKHMKFASNKKIKNEIKTNQTKQNTTKTTSNKFKQKLKKNWPPTENAHKMLCTKLLNLVELNQNGMNCCFRPTPLPIMVIKQESKRDKQENWRQSWPCERTVTTINDATNCLEPVDCRMLLVYSKDQASTFKTIVDVLSTTAII